MPNDMKCKYELCDTTNLAGGAHGYCGAHYRQVRRGEALRPARGSRYYWEARLNDKGEKQCSRCEYWLPLTEFHTREDGSRVNKEFGRAHCRRCNILRRMNITAREYDELLAKQGGGCAGCGKTVQGTGRQLPVDHDHSCCPGITSCGKCVRGILCDDCNTALGRVHDEEEVLLALAEYLRESRHARAS